MTRDSTPFFKSSVNESREVVESCVMCDCRSVRPETPVTEAGMTSPQSESTTLFTWRRTWSINASMRSTPMLLGIS